MKINLKEATIAYELINWGILVDMLQDKLVFNPLDKLQFFLHLKDGEFKKAKQISDKGFCYLRKEPSRDEIREKYAIEMISASLESKLGKTPNLTDLEELKKAVPNQTEMEFLMILGKLVDAQITMGFSQYDPWDRQIRFFHVCPVCVSSFETPYIGKRFIRPLYQYINFKRNCAAGWLAHFLSKGRSEILSDAFNERGWDITPCFAQKLIINLPLENKEILKEQLNSWTALLEIPKDVEKCIRRRLE